MKQRKQRRRGRGVQLFYHRHVDHDTVSLADPKLGEHASETRNTVEQIRVRDGPDSLCDWAVMDERNLQRRSRMNVIDRVEKEAVHPKPCRLCR